MNRKWIAPLVLAAATTVALAAEMVTVNVSDLSIRKKADNYSALAVPVSPPKGAKLEVVDKQGDYLRVNYQGAQGWIRAAELEPVKVGKSGLSNLAAGLSGDTSAGTVQEAGATKGLLGSAEKYARSIGVDPKKVDNLRLRRKKIIDSGEYDAFAAEGKVGAR